LFFDVSSKAPNFSKAILDCEFPWYWHSLNTHEASLPKCSNILEIPKNNMPAAKSVKSKGSQPKSFSGVRFHLSKTKLADPYLNDSTPSGNNTYVTGTTGTDSGTCGATYANACKTISQGITNCSAIGTPCNVLIEYGIYPQTTTLALASGVSLIGGYVGGAPSSQYQSSLTGPTNGSPVISGQNLNMTLTNLMINGKSSTIANQAAVAVTLSSTTGTGITMDNIQINAGTGNNVTTSGTAGIQGSPGGAGGNYSAKSGSTYGTGGTSACRSNNAGGTAGQVNIIGSNCSGYLSCSYQCVNGANNNAWWGNPGNPGQSTGGNGSQLVHYVCSFGGQTSVPAGGAGVAGADATAQAAANTSRIGSIAADGTWSPVAGGNGNPGNDGGGGGGGGAGEGNATLHQPVFDDCYCDTNNGAAGGGGGAGGCGATGGGGGNMGGASFAVVLVDATLTLNSTTTITAAQGGQGGNGGRGATGGAGGDGGANCSCLNSANQAVTGCSANCDSAGQSGAGGNGAAGGASGGGAGGNGGPSVGVVLIGTSTVSNTQAIYPNQSGAVGTGGSGSGTAPTGASGQAGLGQGTYTVN